jgi:hypothetical protein
MELEFSVKDQQHRLSVAAHEGRTELCIGGPLHGQRFHHYGEHFVLETQNSSPSWSTVPERPRVESVMQYVRNYTYTGVPVWFCPQHEKLRS